MPLRTDLDVSVVVPTHNDAGRVADALKSIVGQTRAPLEIIVSDDGSTDNTAEVVERAAASAKLPIEYVRAPVQSGVVAARNRGIRAARGALIATCDSDDYWHPEKLDRQLSFVRTWRAAPLALLATHGMNVNDRRRAISLAPVGPVTLSEYESLRDMGGVFFFIHSSVLFSRDDFDLIGGYSTEYGAADDLHFFGELAMRGPALALGEPLTYYRKRLGSIQTAKFWDQHTQLDRLAENGRRRVRAKAPLSQDEFVSLREPWMRGGLRSGYVRYGWSKYYYRRGAVEIVNGRRIRGAGRLAVAVLLGQDFGRTRTALSRVLARIVQQGV
jgi:glycosyltransferase involved in cell wall biosynthesis